MSHALREAKGMNTISDIRARLFDMQDESYRDFQSALMPTVSKDRIIGVRTPALRAFARGIRNTPAAAAFLQNLPHFYYEENNLHAFLIEFIRDYDACIAALNSFLPHVDNWATCDGMNPKVLGRHLPELDAQIDSWLASSHEYTVRFGIVMCMRWFLDDNFEIRQAERIAALRQEDYYIRMAAAWYFATALAKQWDETLTFLLNGSLDPWIHNKAIQKATESRRISAQQKEFLKKLKIPGESCHIRAHGCIV